MICSAMCLVYGKFFVCVLLSKTQLYTFPYFFFFQQAQQPISLQLPVSFTCIFLSFLSVSLVYSCVSAHQPQCTVSFLLHDRSSTYLRSLPPSARQLLHEYEFDIVHRVGFKHTNADVLFRFPGHNSRDNSGAQMDLEMTTSQF